MGAPEVPARRAVGHTGLDHEPDRPLNPTMGLRTARWGQSGEVRVQVRAARRTGVLRIRDHASPWTPYVESPHVVQRPLILLVPLGLVTTTRTRLAHGGATGRDNLWRWHVGNRSHPCGGIGSIHPRTQHGSVLRARMLKPALYDQGLSGAIPKPGKDAIVSYSGGFIGN